MGLPSPTKKKDIVSSRIKQPEHMPPQELLAFMRKHGISEHEFAEIMGVTIQGVNLWLSGERKMSVTNTRLIRLFEKKPTLIREF